MTRNELVNMAGNEILADLTFEIALKHLRPIFVKLGVQMELQEIKEKLNKLREEGVITGSFHIGSDVPDDVFAETADLIHRYHLVRSLSDKME